MSKSKSISLEDLVSARRRGDITDEEFGLAARYVEAPRITTARKPARVGWLIVLGLFIVFLVTRQSETPSAEASNHVVDVPIAKSTHSPSTALETDFRPQAVAWKSLDSEELGISDYDMTTKLCKAAMAVTMGRPVSIMRTAGVEVNDGVHTLEVSYVRDDGTPWIYDCKVEGTNIVWRAKGGRWRTHQLDEKLTYSQSGRYVVVTQTGGVDGSVLNRETFDLNEI